MGTLHVRGFIGSDQAQVGKIAEEYVPVQSKEAISLNKSVRADDEIGEKAARFGAA